jgi:hypothetical protein
MTTAIQDAMIWMNDTFGAKIDRKLKNSPISKELVIAIGIQETYYVWAKVYKTWTPEQILGVCVGDTIDFPKRKTAWPKNRAALEGFPKGKTMFKLARAALERIAEVNSGYKTAVKNPNKFCHGFGMFQYDIQFFKEDSAYFLDSKWATWDGTFGKGVAELENAVTGLYGAGKAKLSHNEAVFVAIAYNRGVKGTKRDMAKKRFKQGHKDGNGIYYGEHIDANLKAAKGLW